MRYRSSMNIGKNVVVFTHLSSLGRKRGNSISWITFILNITLHINQTVVSSLIRQVSRCLPPWNARRTVHKPSLSIHSIGSDRSVVAGKAGLFLSQPPFRRYYQSNPFFESDWWFGSVHRLEQINWAWCYRECKSVLIHLSNTVLQRIVGILMYIMVIKYHLKANTSVLVNLPSAKAEQLSFPSSVIEYFQGYLGIPPFGFPEPLRSRVLKGRTIKGTDGLSCFSGRPGAQLPSFDFEGTRVNMEDKWGKEKISKYDVMSCEFRVSRFSHVHLFESHSSWSATYHIPD